jgi:hypothetical protein
VRDVGELLSEIFSEQNEVRKQQIQVALQAPHTEAPPRIPEGIESIIQISTGNIAISRGYPRKNQIVVAVSIAAMIVVGGTIAFFTWRGSHAESTRPAPVAAPPPIQVRLTTSPNGATLTVDGYTLSGNPALLTAPADTRDHDVRATLAGYEPFQKVVRFERNLSLEIKLQPLADPTSPSNSATVTDAAAGRVTFGKKDHSSVVSGKKAKVNCDPPFYFDNGIKMYKPGCV